jgi:hypothetical protein
MTQTLRGWLRPFTRFGPQTGGVTPLRLALVGTPRSGNTWLRRLLACGYGLEGDGGKQLAVHDPSHVDWAGEGPRYVVQVHVPRLPEWVGLFSRHGVRVVVPRRHPFDVLISVLNYATRVHDTHLWLAGQGGDESAIRGLHPCHPGFLDYARSPRAHALLAVSQDWGQATGSVTVRYEDLVRAPRRTLARLARDLGERPRVDWDLACERNTMDELRLKDGRDHHWQGRPGHWRSLLTRDAAKAIAEAHRPLFAAHGSEAEETADPDLTPEQALANFRALL